MLQDINNKVRGWFANVILSVLVLAFALWGIQFYLERSGGSDQVAKVNGIVITNAELASVYQHLKQNLNPANFSQDQQKQLQQQALQQIIAAEVLSGDATKIGLRIAPQQLDAVIMQMPVFQENGQFSMQRFQQVLAGSGYSQDQFISDLQRTLLVEQWQTALQNTAFSLPNETQQTLQLLGQQRDIRYAVIAAQQFANAPIAAAAINNYYQQHQDNFKSTEKASIDYLELSVEKLAPKVQVSDADMQQYYQSNLATYSKNGKSLPFASVKDEIAKNLKQQKLQQLFSDQSQKLSDLTYTNASSLTPAATTLGLTIQSTDSFTRQGEKTGIAANPQVVNAVFTDDVLKNKNNSNLIALKDGDVIVLRIKEYQPATVLPLAEVKPQIETLLRGQLAKQAAQQNGEKIVAALNAKTKPNLPLNWKNENNLSRQASNINPSILQTAFGVPVNGVAGVALANGDYAIVAVDKIISDTKVIPTDSQQFKTAQNALALNNGQLDYQLYQINALNQAKIKIYASDLTQLNQ